MLVAGDDEVGVNFVGADKDTVLIANLAHLRQFFLREDLADGVVRVAHDEHFALRGAGELLKVLKVDLIVVTLEDEGIVDDDAALGQNGVGEGIVHGALDDNLIALVREGLNGLI
ncbi:hypothetical protein SDC9_90662 [bioreactor metagenome]|uniref:Uncharacterized protein n=1 Tax=bioreactor metagenome TaxID=1076179 RepID=A0A645A2F6_9ZZZZ